jgi:anti-sigma factor RsiW
MAEFELHGQQCGACRLEAEQLRLYDELLREAFAEQPLETQDMRARVWRQISTSWTERYLLFGQPVYLLLMAALLFLTLGAGFIYLVWPFASFQTVYASAVDNHTEEVVQRVPIEGWRETPVEIERLVRRHLGDSDIISKLAPADYKLARARVCDLADEEYVHLVYKNERREISVYIRHKGNELPGTVTERVNGFPLHAEAADRFEVAGFQSEKFTVLIVSDLPRTENLRLARESAAQIA